MTNGQSALGPPEGQPGTGPPARWLSRRRRLVIAVLVVTVLAAVTAGAGSGSALRPFAVFLFLVLGPGLAITGFLRLHDPATELAVAIPLSLAVDVAVAAAMSLARVWRPDAALFGSGLVTGAALAVQLYRSGPVSGGQAHRATPARARLLWHRLRRPTGNRAAERRNERTAQP